MSTTEKRLTPGSNGYKILFDTNTFIMNKKFAAAAAVYGSKENRIIRNVRHDFPGMTEIIVSGRERKKARSNNRFTYDNMEKYISVQKNAKELQATFETVKTLSKPLASPYKYVCDWFEAQFPDYSTTPTSNDAKEYTKDPVAPPNIEDYKTKEQAKAS